MHKRVCILLAVLMVFSLLLAACDEEPAEVLPEPTPALSESTAAPSGEDEPAEPEEPSDEPGTGGDLVADLGFRPQVNGFQFENYGEGFTNLTPAEMQRIFGDQVCAQLRGDECVLTPPARQWMEQWNDSMNGGHCYGFSVASLRLFQGDLDPTGFGGSSVSDLQIEDNEALQREIAYSFIFQSFDPIWSDAIAGTPNEVLDNLIQVLDPGSEETYTLGFFNAEGGGGHAVTPYAIEDRGEGIFAVLIYDNNWPNEQREMIFDRNANSWTYNAAINPDEPESLYWGDANTESLFLFPTTPGLQTQPCDFCAEDGVAFAGGRLAAPVERYNEIWLDGPGHLLIEDEEGRRLGYVDGKLVNEIPGARYEAVMSGLWAEDREPIYYLPVNVDFVITIDGSHLEEPAETDVVVIGPGYDLGVEGILLQPGQQDTLIVIPQDGILSYATESDVSPNIILGFERSDADFIFEIQGLDMPGGGEIQAGLDTKTNDLIISPTGIQGEGQFSLWLTRIDDEVEETFYCDEIMLMSDAVIYIDFAEWKGEGTPLFIGVDTDGDGELDEEYTVEDES